MSKDKFRDPLAPQISEGQTAEEADAEAERLKRQQLEWELFQDTERFRTRVNEGSKNDK